MGTVITTSTCDQGVTLAWHPDGANYPWLYVVIDTPTGPLGPLPPTGTIDANPNAVYTVTWWVLNERDGDTPWPSVTVTTPPLATDCTTEQPTTQAPPTTSEATTSTTVLVPPSTTAPAFVLDQGVTACDQEPGACVAEVGTPPTLPATGAGDTLLGGGVAFLILGVALVLAARIGRRTA